MPALSRTASFEEIYALPKGNRPAINQAIRYPVS